MMSAEDPRATRDTFSSSSARTATGMPPVVDMATWQAERDRLLAREKAHTHEGDAIAAARRRLPMVEVDATVRLIGAAGPSTVLDLFEGRDRLMLYQHMWHDGAPHQGQCEGCTVTAWHLQDATYLHQHGVSLAIVTTGAWEEVGPYVDFMGYHRVPWYSVRDVEAPIGGDMGHFVSLLRDGDQVFLTYRTTGRGVERANPTMGLLDMTPYGRGETWEDTPVGWPEGQHACWSWRSDAGGRPTWGGTSRPTPQWTRPGATPVTTLGRGASH